MSNKVEPLLQIIFSLSMLMLVTKFAAYASAVWFVFHLQWVNAVALVLIGELFNLCFKQFNGIFGGLAELAASTQEQKEILAPDFIESNSNN